MITIYTDGSCHYNPGPGGFGVIVLEDSKVVNAHYESSERTTNNREEMKAIIWALQNYGNDFFIPIVYTDSAYCVNSFTKWLNGWKNHNWTRAGDKPLENADLIQYYDKLQQEGNNIELRKCKGHADNAWNKLADSLATGKITVNEVLKKYG